MQYEIRTQNEMSEMDLEKVSAGADKISGSLHGRNTDGSGFNVNFDANGPIKGKKK
jgi:hypothetical protein